MAMEEHLAKLKEGVEIWNQWRKDHPDEKPDLSELDFTSREVVGEILWDEARGGAVLREANLSNANLSKVVLGQAPRRRANVERADLRKANLSRADLAWVSFKHSDLSEANLQQANLCRVDFGFAKLYRADLSGARLLNLNLPGPAREQHGGRGARRVTAGFRHADLGAAKLIGADLYGANFTHAQLSFADLRSANLRMAGFLGAQMTLSDLRQAQLTQADLRQSLMVGTRLEGADLSGADVHGIAAWDLITDGATKQKGLIISLGKSRATVDDLELAQFLYLIHDNAKIRNVLDAVIRKVVLILGRFTKDRLAVLKAIADRLRALEYLPVIFDFEPSPEKNVLDTVKILAHLSRFVIMDFTDAKFVPAEAAALENINVVIQPIIQIGHELASIRGVLADSDRTLDPYVYHDLDDLLPTLQHRLVPDAKKMADKWTKRRNEYGKPSGSNEDTEQE